MTTLSSPPINTSKGVSKCDVFLKKDCQYVVSSASMLSMDTNVCGAVGVQGAGKVLVGADAGLERAHSAQPESAKVPERDKDGLQSGNVQNSSQKT